MRQRYCARKTPSMRVVRRVAPTTAASLTDGDSASAWSDLVSIRGSIRCRTESPESIVNMRDDARRDNGGCPGHPSEQRALRG